MTDTPKHVDRDKVKKVRDEMRAIFRRHSKGECIIECMQDIEFKILPQLNQILANATLSNDR